MRFGILKSFLLITLSVGLSLCSYGHSLRVFGDNAHGQLGDGTTTSSPWPKKMLSADVEKVSCGDGHVLILMDDGSLWGVGRNDYGQLGLGDQVSRTVPEQIVASGVEDIAAGSVHSVYVAGGTVYGMGSNEYRQLIQASGQMYLSPQQMSGNGMYVAAGPRNSGIIRTDNILQLAGDNTYGQLGAGSKDTALYFNTVRVGGNGASFLAAQVSIGYRHVVFKTTDQEIWGTGNNQMGQLGLGTGVTETLVAAKLDDAGYSITSIAAGWFHTLYGRFDAGNEVDLWGMGDNAYGQLGLGDTTDRFSPTLISSDKVWAVAAGAGHSMFWQNGTVYTMGYNNRGQLGDGSYVDRQTPVAIVTLSNSGISGLSCGGDHSAFTDVRPEIQVVGNDVVITPGQGNGIPYNGTDFGMCAVGSSVDQAFTISNEGLLLLTLTGNPKIAIEGSNAADFSVIDQSFSQYINVGASVSFTLRFAPSGSSTRNATVRIDSDDPSVPSFTFAVEGFGNAPPTIDAGNSQIVEITEPMAPATINLNGTASDDGLPNPPAVLTYTWSVVSSPYPTEIADTTALDTTAAVDAPGTYTYKLTVTDGHATVSDTVSFFFGEEPYVDAGKDINLLASTFPVSVDFAPTAPGGLLYQWTLESASIPGGGPVPVINNEDELLADCDIYGPGVYVFQLRASTTEGFDASDQVTVTVTKQTNIFPERGFAGVGTVTPEYSLEVIGDIVTKDLVVTTSGADFVFDRKHEMMPLAKLRAYTRTHRHLPGIPSAADMQKNGVKLSDLATRQLAQIEELTLRIIELEKKNRSLRALSGQCDDLINELEAQE